jgi:hypothetical protein
VSTQKGRSVWIVVFAGGLSVVIALGAALEGPFVSHGAFGQPTAPRPDQSLDASAHVTQPTSTSNPALSRAVDISWLVWLLVVVVLTMIAVLVWRVLRNRAALRAQLGESLADQSTLDETVATPGVPDSAIIRRGLEAAAERLDGTRTPRDAIILAWLGLQEAAEDSGMPRRGPETPTEFTTRVFTTLRSDGTAVDVAAADELLALYLRARFDSHPTSDKDVGAARSAIARLSASWPKASVL